MTSGERKDDGLQAPPASDDGDRDVQRELERESKEGAGLIGDTARDRSLSGSSSWTTLPDDAPTREGGA